MVTCCIWWLQAVIEAGLPAAEADNPSHGPLEQHVDKIVAFLQRFIKQDWLDCLREMSLWRSFTAGQAGKTGEFLDRLIPFGILRQAGQGRYTMHILHRSAAEKLLEQAAADNPDVLANARLWLLRGLAAVGHSVAEADSVSAKRDLLAAELDNCRQCCEIPGPDDALWNDLWGLGSDLQDCGCLNEAAVVRKKVRCEIL